MRVFFVGLGWFLLIVAGIGGVIWWSVYKFHDCRRVGHALAYCILDQLFS